MEAQIVKKPLNLQQQASRPVLKYYGGKWRIAPWIISFFPLHKAYIEPFSGAASVLIQKTRCKFEMINDQDEEIINVFRVLQDQQTTKELEYKLKVTPYARSEYVLANHIEKLQPVERARRTIIRAFMGFHPSYIHKLSESSTFRVTTEKTVSNAWTSYADSINTFTDRLQRVTIENKDAFPLIEQFKSNPELLWYIDPPYLAETRTDNKVYRHEFSNDDHARLIDTLMDINGMIVLNGYESKLYEELENHGWQKQTLKTRNFTKQICNEAVWLNPVCQKAQRYKQLELFPKTSYVQN